MSTPVRAVSRSRSRNRLVPALALVSLLLVSSSLRPALTSVGPVLERIGTTTGLSDSALGLLTALPLLGFALFSSIVHGPAARWGVDRVLLAALAVLAAGIAIRSLPALPALWIGTAMIGAGVAFGNVLVPVILRRDHPGRIALFTGLSTSVMTGFAALGAGLAVPLAAALGGWRMSLGLWAVPVVVAFLVWAARTRWAPSPAPVTSAAGAPAEPVGSVWRSATAWQVTAFMGLQSTAYFTLINWLPSVEASRGVNPQTAGWHLFAFQVAGVAAGLAISALMGRRAEQRPACLAVSLAILVAMAGLLWVPQWGVLWIMLAGVGTGSSIVVALSLIALRGRSQSETTRLSGMAQSMGYLLAAGGPIAAGALLQLTGSPDLVLVLVGALALVQAVVAFWAGRDRRA
ncbi:MFS transporter [Nocardiopsis ganjiahuensis]|uniref:MFS transporter n=1 Tax=Nocardiopsis ganjiahuensis TaxID=239984 RepID=UPI00034A3EF6|nr:MFS transporter [Nocardiopsis ganjiahuensis]